MLLWVGDRADPEGPQGRPRREAPLLGCFEDQLQRQPDGHWLIAQRAARFELKG